MLESNYVSLSRNSGSGTTMFPKRFKIGSSRNNEWRCCFCLHVRTATILLGIWQLILHVLALTVLVVVMRNHHDVIRRTQEFDQNNFLPTPLSKIKDDDNPYYLPTTQDGRTIYSSDIDMGALMTLCTLSITLLMVYGTIRGKPIHLLPFFCIQLFDFAITTLTATGYFCYIQSVHRLVAEHWHDLPFRKELLKLSPQYLSLLVLVGFLISMLWKAYTIGIVWRCYKYLTLRQQTTRNTIHYILPGEGSRNPEPDYSTLLRDQEGAYGVFKQTPPPSYQDIMDDQPPPYPAYVAVIAQETAQNSTDPDVGTAVPDVAGAMPALEEAVVVVTDQQVEDNACGLPPVEIPATNDVKADKSEVK